MQIIILIFIAIILVFVGFWLASSIIAGLLGAPMIYAKQNIIVEALKFAKLKSGETFLDLGCGDGRSLMIASQKFNAKAIGVEMSPFCYLQSKIRSRKQKNITVIYKDIRKCQKLIAEADVIYLYLLPKIMSQIEETIFRSIKNNTRVVLVAFKFRTHKPKTILSAKNSKTIRLYQK